MCFNDLTNAHGQASSDAPMELHFRFIDKTLCAVQPPPFVLPSILLLLAPSCSLVEGMRRTGYVPIGAFNDGKGRRIERTAGDEVEKEDARMKVSMKRVSVVGWPGVANQIHVLLSFETKRYFVDYVSIPCVLER